MNKNIIVVGANQTGLVFAAFAKTAGFDVTVYEAKKQCDVAYDWTDDMVEETFEEVGMPLPPKGDLHEKKKLDVRAARKRRERPYGFARRPT